MHGFGASEEDPRLSRRGLPERDRERENLRAAGDAFRGVGDREAERLGDRRRRRLPAAGDGERSTDRTIVVELKQDETIVLINGRISMLKLSYKY